MWISIFLWLSFTSCQPFVNWHSHLRILSCCKLTLVACLFWMPRHITKRSAGWILRLLWKERISKENVSLSLGFTSWQYQVSPLMPSISKRTLQIMPNFLSNSRDAWCSSALLNHPLGMQTEADAPLSSQTDRISFGFMLLCEVSLVVTVTSQVPRKVNQRLTLLKT